MTRAQLLLLTTAFGAPATAQDQATTLAEACRRADVVVVATVTAVQAPSPRWSSLRFRSDEVLRGPIGATFDLLEPSGACCGRALFSLHAGEHRLLFLERTGRHLHPFGAERGVVDPTPDILAHVRSLLAARTAAARNALLLRSLDDANARIAADAAHALASAPNLMLTATDRIRVATVLRRSLLRAPTTAASLLELAARSRDTALLDDVLPLYLDEAMPDRAAMIRRALARMPSAMLCERLPMHCGSDRRRRLRAAELLGAVGDRPSRSLMHRMLGEARSPRVMLCLTEGLLASGATPESLREAVPAPVLELARRRLRTARVSTIPIDR